MSEVRFSDDLEQRLADNAFAKKWVELRFQQMDAYRKPFVRTWEKSYKYYRSIAEPKQARWKARLFVPRIYETIHTILPRLLQGIFAQRPPFAVEPVPDTTSFMFEEEQLRVNRRAQEVELVLNAQIENQIRLRELCEREWILSTLIYGNAPAILTWDEGLKQPRLEVIDLWDFWCDPRAKDMRDAQDACHHIRVPIDLVRQRADQGIYDAQAVEKIKPDGETSWPAMDRLRSLNITSNEPGGDDRIVTLREYWRRSRVITTVQATGDVLRNVPNRLFAQEALPYLLMKYVPVPGELYAMGIPEILENLQLELNENRNLWLDNKKLAMCRMFAVTHEVDTETLVAAPGAVFKVSDPQGGIRPIEIPDLGPSMGDAEAYITADIDRTMGIYDYTRGKAAKANETARGIQLIQSEANQRFAYNLSLIESTIRELGRKLILMNQNLLPLPTYVRQRDENGTRFLPVSEDAFEGTYDVTPVMSSTLGNKDVARTQLTELIALIKQVPEFDMATDYRRLYGYLLQKYEIRDVAGIIKSEERIAAEQQQAMMAQLQQQQEAVQQASPAVSSRRAASPGPGLPGPPPGPPAALPGPAPMDAMQPMEVM